MTAFECTSEPLLHAWILLSHCWCWQQLCNAAEVSDAGPLQHVTPDATALVALAWKQLHMWSLETMHLIACISNVIMLFFAG